jgi:hypothetical protein
MAGTMQRAKAAAMESVDAFIIVTSVEILETKKG